MHRGNSGFIGILKEPTTSSAYGINSLSIQQESKLAGVWPGAVTVPNAPTIGTATATGTTTATVAFTAPGNNGGATITSYTATSNPDGITGTLNQAGNGTITISGLRSGINYTFTVTATNSAGTSASSLSSNQITTYSVPVNTVAPLVTGSATFGSTLNTSTGTWTGNPASFTYSYFWRRQGNIISGANSSSYTITRTDIGSGTYISSEVRATNAGGTSFAFSSNIIGPPIEALVPGAPTIGTAQLTGSTTATVSFTAPASDGGSTIINYFAVSTPDNITGFLSQAGNGTITVNGLNPGRNYTFVVYAQNAAGDGPNSGSSNQVTTPSSSVTANSVSIFGGGGGGASRPRGGGGGAGQYVVLTDQTFSVGTLYQFTVGPGGGSNQNGGNSTWNGTVALAGRGGNVGVTNSVGGRGGNNGDGTKTGGSGGTGNGGGGGGGGGWIGAGANGVAGTSGNNGGAGGSGSTDQYTGISFGGGGGGGSSVTNRQGAGGSGGGGAGGSGSASNGSNATGLASGGGGASGGTGGSGGSGFRGGIYLRLATSANYEILTAGQGFVTSGSGTSIDLTNTSYINYYLRFV
jgi:hypothetical protein